MRNHPVTETSTREHEDAAPPEGATPEDDRQEREEEAQKRIVAALVLIESVRARLVEIEALAHAAAEAVERLPYSPWPTHEGKLERRVHTGRVPFLEGATAETAHRALIECVEGLRAWAA